MTTANMRVYELVQPGDLRLHERAVPQPAEGEVLAQVSVALTCGTDIKTFERGHARLKLPGRLGHEWSGRVVAVGPEVSKFSVGDRIAATPTAPCGDCAYCVRGEENLCLHLLEATAFGAYGEYLLIPRHIVKRNAFKVPAAVPDERAALLEPLACVLHGAGLVPARGDRAVVVLGDGPIGLLFVQLLRMREVDSLILIGRHEARLEKAREMGADVAVNGRTSDPATAVRTLTDGLGADVVIECVGRPSAWEEALGLVRRGGHVLFFGGCEAGTTVEFGTERLHYDELTVRGGFHYTPEAVQRAWDLVCSGALALEALITHRMPLERLPEAFDLIRRREALKVAIVP